MWKPTPKNPVFMIDHISRVFNFKSFEPGWPVSIVDPVRPNLLFVTWCLVSKHARGSDKMAREGYLEFGLGIYDCFRLD